MIDRVILSPPTEQRRGLELRKGPAQVELVATHSPTPTDPFGKPTTLASFPMLRTEWEALVDRHVHGEETPETPDLSWGGADPATPVESSGMERPSRCPTCDSPAADRFPATAHEGEALGCPDEWHLTDPVTPPNDVTKELVERGRRNAAAGRPSHYRKKPVVIEAMRFRPDNDPEEAMRMAHFLEGCTDWRMSDDEPGIIIPTLEGDHLARPGDWIIKGVQGEFYPCKPDIFEATYELAEEDDEVPF